MNYNSHFNLQQANCALYFIYLRLSPTTKHKETGYSYPISHGWLKRTQASRVRSEFGKTHDNTLPTHVRDTDSRDIYLFVIVLDFPICS